MGKSELDAVVHVATDLIISEQYEIVHTSIEHLRKKQNLKTVFVTSENSGEGKSKSILNMAVIFSKAHKRVLLVDCDLRKQSLTQYFNLSNAKGLISLLYNGPSSFIEEVCPTNFDNLYFLPSGQTVVNPTELLLSDTFHNTLVKMKENFDLILFDTPPLEEVTDTLIIARELDGCILVMRDNGSKDDAQIRVKDTLDSVATSFIGTIDNAVQLLAAHNSSHKLERKKHGILKLLNR
jgi:capsular exopolysaccharide synthesis family protein